MFTKKIVTLLVITLFAFISAASVIKAQEIKTLKVDPKLKMVDTGVKINPGDIVEVTDVTGKIKLSGPADGRGGITHEGNKNTKKSTDYFEFANAAEHSLVMWIGNKGKHFQARKLIATEADTGGNLFFALNDGKNHYGDNSGEFNVTYKIIRKDNLCSQRTNEKVNIKWINKTGIPIRVNWFNFKCQEEPSDRLIQPGGVFDGISYKGHIFRVREDGTKKDLGLIVVEPAKATFDIYK